MTGADPAPKAFALSAAHRRTIERHGAGDAIPIIELLLASHMGVPVQRNPDPQSEWEEVADKAAAFQPRRREIEKSLPSLALDAAAIARITRLAADLVNELDALEHHGMTAHRLGLALAKYPSQDGWGALCDAALAGRIDAIRDVAEAAAHIHAFNMPKPRGRPKGRETLIVQLADTLDYILNDPDRPDGALDWRATWQPLSAASKPFGQIVIACYEAMGEALPPNIWQMLDRALNPKLDRQPRR